MSQLRPGAVQNISSQRVTQSKNHVLFVEALSFAEGLTQNWQDHLVFRAPRCGFDLD